MTNEESEAEEEEKEKQGYLYETCIIVLVFTFICTLCMVITGGSVYAAYGWKGSGSEGPNATFYTKMAGMLHATSSKVINLSRKESRNATTISCPIYGTCPPIVGRCWGKGCVTQKPACKITTTSAPRFCRNPPTCPSYSCPEQSCGTTASPSARPQFVSAIDIFRTSDRQSLPMWKWIQLFPPMSSGRLEVITTLMNDYLEKWVLATFAIRCPNIDAGNNFLLLPNAHNCDNYCSFCGRSRYDYISCAMRNNLSGSGYAGRSTGDYQYLFEFEDGLKATERAMFAGGGKVKFSLITEWNDVNRNTDRDAYRGFDNAMEYVPELRNKYAVVVKGYDESKNHNKDEWICKVCDEREDKLVGLHYEKCFSNSNNLAYYFN